ncbi:hypothetical protein HID58_043362, partial [Brassica napus]
TMPLRMKIQSININSHVLDRLHHAETQPQISYKATTKSPFSLPLSSSNEHCQDRSDVVMSSAQNVRYT